ncbi:hypothetical protein ACSVC9_11725 [Clostridium sp. LBM24168]
MPKCVYCGGQLTKINRANGKDALFVCENSNCVTVYHSYDCPNCGGSPIDVIMLKGKSVILKCERGHVWVAKQKC